MKSMISAVAVTTLSIAGLGASQAPNYSPAGGAAAHTEVRGGSITFDVGTNIFAIKVHGASGALDGRAGVRESAQGLRLERIEAVVPVDSLKTGLKQRDAHMRKYIFETTDGQAPDVRFSADKADCSHAGSERELTCVAAGVLSIRGTARPFSIPLKVTRNGDDYRVVGDGTVALSTWGIERPSQFGVKTNDEVALHLEFNAKTAAAPALSSARSR
jgi:polyisoprenoid-binding protein YceI